MPYNPTKSQQQVLNDNSKKLLVSASAGSGKTATVIQKILNLILKDKIDIQELLVITFTESASLEMKIRLKEKLFEEVNTDASLIKQIDKLPTSDISTIHGFCSKCIRKYFYELDINPNFAVLDDSNAKFLKGLAINKVIENYSNLQDEDFISISQIFSGGRNFSALKENVINFYEFLCAISNKEDYLNNISVSCYNENLKNNPACEVLNNYILSNTYYAKKTLEEYLIKAKQEQCEYFIDFINNVLNNISGIDYKNTFLQNRQEILNLPILSVTTKKDLQEQDNNFKVEFLPFYNTVKSILQDLQTQVINRPIEELIKELQQAKSFITKFIEIENAFEKEYNELKDKHNSLDFNDLEKYFLELLNIDRVREAISSNYKYIFVDEYQDINNVQEQILTKLTNKNNITMVGDVKQSIYSFRNSSPAIFVNKSINYQTNKNEGTLINLNENFRSNPKILNFVNAIFNVCMSQEFGGVDYFKNGSLNGMTEYKDVSNAPVIEMHLINTKKSEEQEENNEVYSYPYSVLEDKNNYSFKNTKEHKEATIIAKKILNLVGQNYYEAQSKEIKKITYGDIAVLARSNEFLKQIAKVLLEYKIPITINNDENIYRNSDVQDIFSILKVVNNSHDDISLSVALTGFMGKLSFDELASIRNKFCDEEFLYESVNKYVLLESDEINLKLKDFFNKIYSLRDSLKYCSIYDMLNNLQNEYDFLSFYKMLPNGEDRYNTIKNYINSFATLNFNNDLNRYIDFVENYAKDAKTSASNFKSPNSVKLGTIHSSKGLEYPVVFLAGTGNSFSNQTFINEIIKDKDLGLGIRFFNLTNSEKFETLARNAILVNLKKQERAEELRLLYVALTRAKNNLIIIGSKNLTDIARITSLKEAQTSNCYLNWILCGLSDVSFSALKHGKISFEDKQKDFNVSVTIYQDNFLEEVVNNDININLKDINLENVNKLLKSFNFETKKTTNLALKNTVSSMLQEHAEDGVSVNFEPKKLEVSENKKENIDASRLGTIYHNIMEKVDFNSFTCCDKESITKIVDGFNLEDKYLKKVDVNKIQTCIKKIKEFNINKYLKEQPFLSYLPYNFIFKESNITDKILIQGVADLILDTYTERILIDYKTTKAKTKNELAEKYDIQLKLYKTCLEKATNKKIDKVLIYSFWFDDFIELK